MYDFSFLLLLAKVHALNSNRFTGTGSHENRTKGDAMVARSPRSRSNSVFQTSEAGEICVA